MLEKLVEVVGPFSGPFLLGLELSGILFVMRGISRTAMKKGYERPAAVMIGIGGMLTINFLGGLGTMIFIGCGVVYLAAATAYFTTTDKSKLPEWMQQDKDKK